MASEDGRADARRSRERIIGAVLGLLAGGASPTMEAVAASAGVGRVTVFRHFSSRQQLLEAALERGFDEAEAELEGADLDVGPADAALERAVGALLHLSGRYAVLTAHLPVGGAAVEERIQQLLGPVVALVERGRQEGAFRADLPSWWLAEVVLDLCHGAALNPRAGKAAAPALVLDVLRHGLVGPDGTVPP